MHNTIEASNTKASASGFGISSNLACQLGLDKSEGRA